MRRQDDLEEVFENSTHLHPSTTSTAQTTTPPVRDDRKNLVADAPERDKNNRCRGMYIGMTGISTNYKHLKGFSPGYLTEFNKSVV